MTARIHRSFDFHAGVYFDGDFYMNSYDVDITFNVESESIQEQNIALERVKYFLQDCLEHSIFVYEKEDQAINKYLDADLKVCTLPEQPYDQVVGIMLLVKLNAIAEGRLVPTDISIGSRMSDGVSCLHSLEEDTGPFKQRGWWNDSSTKINNHIQKSKNKKILKITKYKAEWNDLYLAWPSDENTDSGAEIVFASFDSKTDK
jgi:hypothetical protein